MRRRPRGRAHLVALVVALVLASAAALPHGAVQAAPASTPHFLTTAEPGIGTAAPPRRTPVRRGAELAGSGQPVVQRQPAPAPPPAVPATPAGPAFGAQFHGMWAAYSDSQREQVLATMAAAGVTSVRIDLSWAMLQPHGPDSYDPWGVGFADRVLGMAEAHGLRPLVTLWLTPGWANGGAGERALPSDPFDYARAAAWAAQRWRGTVVGWEVWNEPNSTTYLAGADPVGYAKLLRAAYPAFKKGDPGAAVVFGGPEYVDVPWVQRVLDAGATSSFDVMGVHPYMGQSDAGPGLPDDGTIWRLRHVSVLRDALVRAGRADAPIWFTEFGWSTTKTAPDAPVWARGVSEAQQAQYLVETVRLVRHSMPYVGRLYWYNDLVDIQDGFAAGYGLVRADGTPTPALRAVSTA